MDKNNISKEIAAHLSIENEKVHSLLEIPPDEALGDFALPCFSFAKEQKKAPNQIASELAKAITIPGVKIESNGPYVNFFIDAKELTQSILKSIDSNFGNITLKNPPLVLVESPGPNTNKPLHLGHLRNVLLGQAIHNVLCKIGKDSHLINIVNDRGIHICKSMLAYQKFGNSATPESTNMKPDHFVGHYYVKFAQEVKNHPDMEDEAKKLLVKWENKDPETMKLWETMNNWAYEGWKQTYQNLQFNIEKEYYESFTYQGGKDIIQKGLEEGLFEKDKNGAIFIDLEKEKLGKKILLRGDGTSVYITQDINTARLRVKDYNFDEMIYVVGNEQEYHFKVLFEVFKALNWDFASKCKHFSYGMVELPSGKMKSREGTVIDTDEVIEKTYQLAKEEVEKRYENLSSEEINSRAKIISQGAYRFFFLKHDAIKNFVFDIEKSLSFEGETGPYVQYTHARICSIIRKAEKYNSVDLSKLDSAADKELVKILSDFPKIIQKTAKDLKPNYIANYLLKVSQRTNSYYVNNRILQDNKELQHARVELIKKVNVILKEGLRLLGIAAPEEM